MIMLCAPSTDPTDIIPTLLSRSRHVYVPQPTTEQVVAVLTRDGSITEEDARLAAASPAVTLGGLAGWPAMLRRSAAARAY